MKHLIYESPKKERKRSAPVAENDTVTRQRLEAMGWHVVEKWDDAPTVAQPSVSRYAEWTHEALWEEAALRELVVDAERGEPTNEKMIAALEAYDEADERAQALKSIKSQLDFLTDEQHEALMDAGFGDEAALRAATDDQLRDVPGIGPATVRNLRAALQPE